MELWINTKDRNNISVGLKKGDVEVDNLITTNQQGSQVLLSLIKEILGKNRLDFEDLKGIKVEIGSGSFTGIRVGVSVANALGFALGIPVNGKEMEEEIEYS